MMTQINRSYHDTIQITETDLEIIQMIAYEYEFAEIATELDIPPDRVPMLIEALCKKLEVNNVAGLLRVAYEKRMLLLCESPLHN